MLDDGVYCIKSVTAGKWLNKSRGAGSAKGAKVQIWGSRHAASQWRVKRVHSDVFTLKNIHSRTWLNKKRSDGSRNGATVHMWKNPDSNDSQWRITDCGDGTITLQNISSGTYLNKRRRDGSSDGGLVHMWDNPASQDNRWVLESVSADVGTSRVVGAGPANGARGQQKCQLLFVPSEADQQALEALGFITQQKYRGANWGGAHVTIGQWVWNDDARRSQVRVAADACKGINMVSAGFRRSWVGDHFHFLVTSPQADQQLKDAGHRARRAGWGGNIRPSSFHCTAFVRPEGRRRGEEIGQRLRGAQWGFVLALETGRGEYSFDWGSFVPVSV